MTAVVLENLLSPAVLFFLLGMAAAVLRSNLQLPVDLSKSLTLFLLIAIGFKGGVALATEGLAGTAWLLLFFGVLFSFVMPLLGFAALRRLTNLNPEDAAVVAAHYGSVSVVTFMAAVTYLQVQGLSFSGHMVVLMVAMEIPAVISGIWLARRVLPLPAESAEAEKDHALAGLFSNHSVILLLGSLLIGASAQGVGRSQLEEFLVTPLYGVLCLFLLDMGIKAGRQLETLRSNARGLVLFGLGMPLIGGMSALLLGTALGVGVADATLFAVLAASASYIVVPAAMQVAVPDANSEIGTSLSMGVTFPFNVALGIPLFFGAASLMITG